MTAVPHASHQSSISAAASSTYYFPAASANYTTSTTEATEQTIVDSARVLSYVTISIGTNNRGASTLNSRVNGANGNTNLSIGASQTGQFEDTTHIDSLVAGDQVCIAYESGSGGTATNINGIDMHIEANDKTVSRFLSRIAASLSTANVTRYVALVGSSALITTADTNVQLKVHPVGTFSSLYVYISANARTTTTNIRLRINAADGNLVVPVLSGVTGAIEDSTHTDVIAAGDLINYSATTAASDTNSITFETFAVAFATTDYSWEFIVYTSTNFTNNQTRWMPVGGRVYVASTENNLQIKVKTPFTWSNLYVRVPTNALVAVTATITARKGSSATSMLVTFAAGVTGTAEDTTHSVSVAVDELLNYEVAIPIGSGTITIVGASSKAVASAPGNYQLLI